VETNKDEGAIAHELRRRKLYVREKKATTNKFLRITDLVLKNWDKIRLSPSMKKYIISGHEKYRT
jgi:hypothetical protein